LPQASQAGFWKSTTQGAVKADTTRAIQKAVERGTKDGVEKVLKKMKR
jgi:hypothetical protein